MNDETNKEMQDETNGVLPIFVYDYSHTLEGNLIFTFKEEITYPEYKESYHPDTKDDACNQYVWDLALNKGYTVGFESNSELQTSHLAITGPVKTKLGVANDLVTVRPQDGVILYSVDGSVSTYTDRQIAKQYKMPRSSLKKKLRGLNIDSEAVEVLGYSIEAVSYRDKFLRTVVVVN